MRIAALADLHGHLPDTPPCDVLVIAGDLPPWGVFDDDEQVAWLAGELRPWLEARPAQHVVGIAGNHDFVFERAPDRVPDLPWTYLRDDGCELDGVRFWGSPWTPWFHDWAFNAPKGPDGEAFLAERYAPIAAGTEVLLIHGPPAGYGDRTVTGHDAGSTALLECIDRVQPALCAFGHIHEGRGAWTRGATQLANVAAVDLERRPVAEPAMVFDL